MRVGSGFTTDRFVVSGVELRDRDGQVAAGILMGIDVVDHIILGDVRYCSFKAIGKI